MKQKSISFGLCVCVAFFVVSFLNGFAVAQETAPLTPLAAPSDLTASVTGGNVVTLNWTDNASGETGFKVYWKKDSLPFGELRYFPGIDLTTATFEVPLVGTSPTSFAGPGTFVFKVQSMRINSDQSISYSTTTSNQSNPVTITAPTATETGTENTSPSTGSGTSGTNTPGTSDNSGTTSGSSGGTASPTVSTKPSAPTNLAVSVAGSVVTLTWLDTTGNEAGFKLYKNSGSGWTDIGNAPANATTFNHQITVAGTYRFRMQSFVQLPTGGFEYSYPSAEVSAAILTATPPALENTQPSAPMPMVTGLPATNTDPDAPAAPTNLTAAVNGSDITLTWTDNATNEMGYKIYRNYNGKGITDIGNVGADVASFTDKNLIAGTYLYRLNAFRQVNGAYKYSKISNDVTVSLGSEQSETTTVSLTLTVFTKNTAGQPLPNIYVSLEGGPNALLLARKTDASGTASFSGAGSPGRYTVRASSDSSGNYLTPPIQIWEVAKTETREMTFVFEPKTASDLLEARGQVKFEDGRPADALVWGWSEDKDAVSMRAGADGVFAFKAKPGSVWHLGAAKESEGQSFIAEDATVNVGLTAPSFGLTLKKVALPTPPAVKIGSAETAITAETKDGAGVTVPAGAVSSGGGQLTLEIKSTVETPVLPSKLVVSTVYDITVKDNTGSEITSFNQPIEVGIPYKESELKALSVDEKHLKPSYYDEQLNTWVPITDYVLDTAKNLVLAKVDHLTRFAIVMPADSTPPSAPQVVKAEALNSGAIHLTWKNPEKDFKFVRIFRSEMKGEKGPMVQNSLAASSYVDSGVILGKNYYYLVKSVDLAGNESTNTEALPVKSVKGAALQKEADAGARARIVRDLKIGTKGEDVKALQDFLKSQKMFSAKSTGYYGTLTKSSIIKFQNRYAEETWKADKLKRPNGVVTGSTRNKLNQVLP